MSYGGIEAPLVFGDFGLIGQSAMGDSPPNALIQAENIAYQSAELVPALGSTTLNTSALSQGTSVVGLIEWSPFGTGVAGPGLSFRRLIAMTYQGEILRDEGDGQFSTLVTTGLFFTHAAVMVAAGEEEVGNVRKLFFSMAGIKVRVLEADGTTTREIGPDAPAEWTDPLHPPYVLIAHAARLWGFAGNRAYASSVLDHENFTDTTNGALTQVIGTGVGEMIWGAIVFKEQLFLWKWPQGIFIYDTRDPDTTKWQITELTRAIGIAGPRAVDVGGNEVLFISETGHLHLLSNVRNNDVEASDLVTANRLQDWWKQNVEQSQYSLAGATVKYYPERQEFHCTLPRVGSAHMLVSRNPALPPVRACDLRVVVDMQKPGTPRLSIITKDVCASLATRQTDVRTQQLLAGDNQGFVWTIDDPQRSQQHFVATGGGVLGTFVLGTDKLGGVALVGTAYTCIFQTPHDDFNWVDAHLRTRRKNLQFLELHGTAQGPDLTIPVELYLDGALRETVSFTHRSTAVLGTMILGQAQFGGVAPLRQRRKIRGSCHRLSLLTRFSANHSAFRIASFIVSFTPDGHRMS